MSNYLTIIALAGPIILARLTLSFGSVIGTWIISGLGTEVLAASALTTAIYLGLFTFVAGNLYGISPLIAKEHSKKNHFMVMNILIQGFYYATVLGILIITIFYNISWLLKIFHEPPEVINLVKKYYQYFAPSVLPMLWTTVLQEALIGTQRQKIIYFYGLLRMLLGVFLAYVLVLGKYGFPRMEFAGLGLSVSIASTWSCFSLAVYLCWCERNFIRHNFNLKRFIPTRQILKLIRFGIPIGLQLSVEILAIMLATLLIGSYGLVALATQQIVFQYVLLFTMLPFGFSQAIAAHLSKLRAQNQHELTHKTIYQSLIIVALLMLLLDISYILATSYFLAPYLHKYSLKRVEIIVMATQFFHIIVIYQLFDGIRIVLSGILRGYGNSHIAMLTGIGCFWIIGLPMVMFLIRYSTLGPVIIPISLTTAVVLSTIILSIYSFLFIRKH